MSIGKINQAINLLLQKTPELETLSYTSSYCGTIYVCRYGRMVQVFVSNAHGLPANKYTTICTLPTGWRPPREFVQMLRSPTQGDLRIRVTTAGAVDIYNYATASQTNATGSIIFPTSA